MAGRRAFFCAVPVLAWLVLLASQVMVSAAGNTVNDSFSAAKKMLEREVYADHRETLYCGYKFGADKRVDLPEGFSTPRHLSRALRIEWEHAVPAENFGRAFSEWRDGDAQCVNRNGQPFSGRRCAEKVNMEYRYMQADMYNLFPAVGAVNALRSNYNYAQLPDLDPTFGSCEMKIDERAHRADPPERARGQVARASLYMDASYPRFSLSRQQKQLFTAWDKIYPVDAWECTRAKRIESLQGNENSFVKKPCQEKGLW